MASAVASGVFPAEMAEETVEIVTRARLQAQQLIERLRGVKSWVQFIPLLEAALARVHDGRLLDNQGATHLEEEANAESATKLRGQIEEVIAQLEPQHIAGRFELKMILKVALERAQVWQYFYEAH
jgi:hypothetical protein